mmetsp:Transcript_62873/g.124168  ORF Transcript_62873/g.124168 Transcript_62873/m.124168 type:complete len:307 (-) Transcript_62873:412-1332(-)
MKTCATPLSAQPLGCARRSRQRWRSVICEGCGISRRQRPRSDAASTSARTRPFWNCSIGTSHLRTMTSCSSWTAPPSPRHSRRMCSTRGSPRGVCRRTASCPLSSTRTRREGEGVGAPCSPTSQEQKVSTTLHRGRRPMGARRPRLPIEVKGRRIPRRRPQQHRQVPLWQQWRRRRRRRMAQHAHRAMWWRTTSEGVPSVWSVSSPDSSPAHCHAHTSFIKRVLTSGLPSHRGHVQRMACLCLVRRSSGRSMSKRRWRRRRRRRWRPMLRRTRTTMMMLGSFTMPRCMKPSATRSLPRKLRRLMRS